MEEERLVYEKIIIRGLEKKKIIIMIQNEIYVSFWCSWISNINLLFSYGNKLLLRITCTHDDKSIKFTERTRRISLFESMHSEITKSMKTNQM